MGAFVNDITPEVAAARLRDVGLPDLGRREAGDGTGAPS
jgi:hypothetical protein